MCFARDAVSVVLPGGPTHYKFRLSPSATHRRHSDNLDSLQACTNLGRRYCRSSARSATFRLSHRSREPSHFRLKVATTIGLSDLLASFLVLLAGSSSGRTRVVVSVSFTLASEAAVQNRGKGSRRERKAEPSSLHIADGDTTLPPQTRSVRYAAPQQLGPAIPDRTHYLENEGVRYNSTSKKEEDTENAVLYFFSSFCFQHCS